MEVRKCDYCGKDIEAGNRVLCKIIKKKGYYQLSFTPLRGLCKNYDLCKECASRFKNEIEKKQELMKSSGRDVD